MMKQICGYNLIEGAMNSGSCSANEKLLGFIVNSYEQGQTWRNECKSHTNEITCTRSTVPDNVNIDPISVYGNKINTDQDIF